MSDWIVSNILFFWQGVVHKLRLQEEGVGSPNKLTFCHKVENVNGGGLVVKNSQNLFNVFCEWPLKWSRSWKCKDPSIGDFKIVLAVVFRRGANFHTTILKPSKLLITAGKKANLLISHCVKPVVGKMQQCC